MSQVFAIVNISNSDFMISEAMDEKPDDLDIKDFCNSEGIYGNICAEYYLYQIGEGEDTEGIISLEDLIEIWHSIEDFELFANELRKDYPDIKILGNGSIEFYLEEW